MFSQLSILNTILCLLIITSTNGQWIKRSSEGDQVNDFKGVCTGHNVKHNTCSCESRETLYFNKTNKAWVCKTDKELIEALSKEDAASTCNFNYMLINPYKVNTIKTSCNQTLPVNAYQVRNVIKGEAWSSIETHILQNLTSFHSKTIKVNGYSKALSGLLIKINLWKCKSGLECWIIKIPGARNYPLNFTLIESEVNKNITMKTTAATTIGTTVTTTTKPSTEPVTNTIQTSTPQTTITSTTQLPTTTPATTTTITTTTTETPAITTTTPTTPTTTTSTNSVKQTTSTKTNPPTSKKKSSDSSTLIIIIVVLGVLLIVLAIILIVILMRRRKRSQSTTNMELQQTEPLYHEYDSNVNRNNTYTEQNHEYETINDKTTPKKQGENMYDYAYGQGQNNQEAKDDVIKKENGDYSYAYNDKDAILNNDKNATEQVSPSASDNEGDKQGEYSTFKPLSPTGKTP